MADIIEEPVSVATALTSKTMVPERVEWRHHIYTCLRCTMHYTTRDGETLLHVFFMTTKEACMQLIFNTATLRWTIQSIEAL
ncbi:MAG: hypothetical protein V1917_04085 [Candidatus Gottesmanbacteria bacterium]